MASQRLTEDWLAMEKYRLEVIQEWPDGPRKAAARKAILSQMQSLQRPVDAIALPGPLPLAASND